MQRFRKLNIIQLENKQKILKRHLFGQEGEIFQSFGSIFVILPFLHVFDLLDVLIEHFLKVFLTS